MKKFNYTWLLFTVLFISSCNSKYLDKIPESSGYTTELVFGDSINYRNFVDNLVLIPSFKRFNDGYSPMRDWDDITDNSFSDAQYTTYAIANGDYVGFCESGYSTHANNGTWTRLWQKIRIANVGLESIDKYPGSEATKKRIIGQCLYFRADSYFEIVRRWGGMPYLTVPLAADADMDIPRLGYQESLLKIAQDFAEAAKYLTATVSQSEFQFPTSIAALAFKSRALLYAASDFATKEVSGSKNLWEEAALSADQAIRAAQGAGHQLVPMTDYYYLFKEDREAVYLKEILYGRRYVQGWGNTSYKDNYRPGGQLGGSAATGPSQNLIDCFEMQATGLPVSDPLSGYQPQNPYAGRDPRFYQDIITNQQKVMNMVMQIYNTDNTVVPAKQGSASLLITSGKIEGGYTFTGYYNNKWMGQTYNANLPVQWPDIRLAELYLNFAEAANEAWATPATQNPSCLYTAEQALNIVRNRAQMPNVNTKYLNKADFRGRVRNERRIEFCFEDHRLFDIRRWHIAHLPENRDIWGVFITKVPVSATYPTGFMYQSNLVKNRIFEEKHYLFPIKRDNTLLGPNFKQNPGY